MRNIDWGDVAFGVTLYFGLVGFLAGVALLAEYIVLGRIS